MGTFTFENGRTTPGLQAADLFSWELRRFYTELAVKPQYQARWPLEQILKGPAGNAGYALVKYISHEYMQLQLLGAVGSYEDARNTLLELLGEKFRQ